MKDQPEHIFINNARICGMAAIVMVHSIGGYLILLQESTMPILAMILCQLCKFGTVAFFIASGFLTGERIERVQAGEYLKRRMHNVFLPWLFWCVLWCVTVAVFDGLRGRLVIAGWKDVAWAALRYTKVGLFGSPFWFVPNLLLAITILLVSKRFLSDSLIGVASAILSLLYGINIYTRWIPAAHMEALGGFIFYLWLGMWGARNHSFLHERISRIATKYFLLAAILTGCLAMGEARVLVTLRGAADSLNTLRVSNQLYSISLMLVVLKIRYPLLSRFVDARSSIFGVYLTHSLILNCFVFFLRHICPDLKGSMVAHSATGMFLGVGCIFLTTCAGSLALTHFFRSKRSISWIVGVRNREIDRGSALSQYTEAVS